MFCYNLISVYCPVPYYLLWCKRYNGEKLEFNCLFYTKSFLAHRIFMKLKRRAKEGRLVQPQYHTHHFSSISETAAFLVSISVWEKAPFKSSSSPQLCFPASSFTACHCREPDTRSYCRKRP